MRLFWLIVCVICLLASLALSLAGKWSEATFSLLWAFYAEWTSKQFPASAGTQE